MAYNIPATDENDGGPAFPNGLGREGMTLRDYFAAQCMQGLVVNRSVMTTYHDLAATAYNMADAMIAVREH